MTANIHIYFDTQIKLTVPLCHWNWIAFRRFINVSRWFSIRIQSLDWIFCAYLIFLANFDFVVFFLSVGNRFSFFFFAAMMAIWPIACCFLKTENKKCKFLHHSIAFCSFLFRFIHVYALIDYQNPKLFYVWSLVAAVGFFVCFCFPSWFMSILYACVCVYFSNSKTESFSIVFILKIELFNWFFLPYIVVVYYILVSAMPFKYLAWPEFEYFIFFQERKMSTAIHIHTSGHRCLLYLNKSYTRQKSEFCS